MWKKGRHFWNISRISKIGFEGIKRWGTHHSFYLLGAEVVHDSGAVLSESCSVSQKSIDGDLGGHADVRQVNAFVAPLRNVKQPLAGGVVLKQVGKLEKINGTFSYFQ